MMDISKIYWWKRRMGKIALVKDPSHFFKNINGATLIHANALINL